MEEKFFKVTDASSADWALMKLREVAKQEKQDKKLYEENLDRIKQWYERAKGKTDNDRSYFEALLNEYMSEQVAEDPKYKLSTPNGRLSTRKGTDWVHDDKKLLERLKGTEFIKTTEKVNWKAYKDTLTIVNGKVIDQNGEIVEGISATPKLTITIKTED